MQAKEIAEWYIDAGVDETIAETSVNRLKKRVPEPSVTMIKEEDMAARKPKPTADFLAQAPSQAIAEARSLADKAKTREELEQMVRNFDGCALKKFATTTVFSDGNPKARVMAIGEAPGAQEDLQGIPFCGPSGMLLDKMFASAGLTRKENLYISNTLFWRPPGNRQPSKEELAMCQPFVEKHIALMNPELLILAGGTAVGSLLQKEVGITRLRGKFHEYQNGYMSKPVPVAILFHPSYLLRQPGQKRQAWYDLLMIRHFLDEKGIK